MEAPETIPETETAPETDALPETDAAPLDETTDGAEPPIVAEDEASGIETTEDTPTGSTFASASLSDDELAAIILADEKHDAQMAQLDAQIETDVATAEEPELPAPSPTADVYVHKPVRFVAQAYTDAQAEYFAPFAAAIYSHQSWPAGAQVMTPEGVTIANPGDYMVSEEGTGIVRVYPANQFHTHFEEAVAAE